MKWIQFMSGNYRSKVGEVGIEIEAEYNKNVDTDQCPKGWLLKPDGSLRGEYSAELVLRQPARRDKVEGYVDSAYSFFKKYPPESSDNCSVHVHVNCQELEVYQVVNYAVLYYILEPALMGYCGEHREGNLFCLSGLDAELQYEELERVALHSCRLKRDELKYAALNLNALSAYGSLEFRAMRFPITQKEMSTWVSMLLEIKDSAVKIGADDSLLSKFSELGIADFVKLYLPNYHGLLNVKKYEDDIRSVMYRVQPVVYANIKYNEQSKEDDKYKKDAAATGPVRNLDDRFPSKTINNLQDHPHNRGRNVDWMYRNIHLWGSFDLDRNIQRTDDLDLIPGTTEYYAYAYHRVPNNRSVRDYSQALRTALNNEDYRQFKSFYQMLVERISKGEINGE